MALAIYTGPSFAARVAVGSGGRHQSISDGIAAAASGDTVLVAAGTYHEHGILIDKTITLLGIGRPVVDARDEGEIITVRANGVRVEGLVLANVGSSFMEDRAAIRVADAFDCVVENNELVNAFFGIYLENSGECIIRGNVIRGSATREVTSGNGIHLWYCRGIELVDNRITGHRDGIYFEFVEDSHVERNHSQNNLRYGLHFMFSHNDRYVDNAFIENGAGVAVMYSHHVTMARNRFEKNWGTASYGLLLKEIKDSEIHHNRFERNTIAVYTEGSDRVKVRENEFVSNGYAVKLMANSNDNVYERNNFIGNSFDVVTNSRHNFNTFHSNYWSAYRGYDLDRDGAGDVPYHPVRLFALLVEREPPGIILLNSLFVRLIDTAERVMPVFTPETLIDDAPLMRPLRLDERSDYAANS